MKNIVKTSVLIGFIFLASCEKTPERYKPGKLPDTPVNLTDFNTQYDDFNSAAPSSGYLIPFCFSTNRNSNGNEFDIIYMPMNVNFDKATGVLTVSNEYANWGIYREQYEKIKSGLHKIKSTGNELGPHLILGHDYNEAYFTLLYSTDITGNSRINFVSNKTDNGFSEPKEVAFLNSDFDDMYPAFNAERNKIYFSSNRNGVNFNLYYTHVDPNTDIESLLSDPSEYEIFQDTTLSGDYDDKCPFIFMNVMVFASNRSGGFGGYDLYYSIFENGKWGEPINFGDKINTAFDEFRPVLIDEGVSATQTMMVFSSNRPGGLGGFDLYFVGIDK